MPEMAQASNIWNITAARRAGGMPVLTPWRYRSFSDDTLFTPPSFCPTLRFTRSYADWVSDRPNISSTSATPSATLKSFSNPSSNQNKSYAREIAGAIVGGVAGVALLATSITWYLRRRRWHAEARTSPYAHHPQAIGLQDNGTNMSVGRYYVRQITYWHSLIFSPTSIIVRRFNVKCNLTCQDPSDPSTFPRSFQSPSASAIHNTASTEGVYSGESIRPYDRSRYPGLPLV